MSGKRITQEEAIRYKIALHLIAENTTGKNAKTIAQLSLIIAREALQPGYSKTLRANDIYPTDGAKPATK